MKTTMKTCQCEWHLFASDAKPSGPACVRAGRELLRAVRMEPLSAWEQSRSRHRRGDVITPEQVLKAQEAYVRKQARYRADGLK